MRLYGSVRAQTFELLRMKITRRFSNEEFKGIRGNRDSIAGYR